MTEDREASIRLTIQNLISDHDDRLYAEFDKLHKRGIYDDAINKALWSLGAIELAEGYLDWQNDGEPVTADEDGPLDQGEQLVTDPGDAPSYSGMHTNTTGRSTDRPGSLSEELTAAGINADNLEQALLGAVNENRINHGMFFAERGASGNWHVYKRRSPANGSDSYVASAKDREGAQSILNSLGTGF